MWEFNVIIFLVLSIFKLISCDYPLKVNDDNYDTILIGDKNDY